MERGLIFWVKFWSRKILKASLWYQYLEKNNHYQGGRVTFERRKGGVLSNI